MTHLHEATAQNSGSGPETGYSKVKLVGRVVWEYKTLKQQELFP